MDYYIACQKPVDLGYSAEVWTRALLTKHIHQFAEEPVIYVFQP